MNKNVFNNQIILKMTVKHQISCNTINANCNHAIAFNIP